MVRILGWYRNIHCSHSENDIWFLLFSIYWNVYAIYFRIAERQSIRIYSEYIAMFSDTSDTLEVDNTDRKHYA